MKQLRACCSSHEGTTCVRLLTTTGSLCWGLLSSSSRWLPPPGGLPFCLSVLPPSWPARHRQEHQQRSVRLASCVASAVGLLGFLPHLCRAAAMWRGCCLCRCPIQSAWRCPRQSRPACQPHLRLHGGRMRDVEHTGSHALRIAAGEEACCCSFPCPTTHLQSERPPSLHQGCSAWWRWGW